MITVRACTQSMSSLESFVCVISEDVSTFSLPDICQSLIVLWKSAEIFVWRFSNTVFTCFAFCLSLCQALPFDCILSATAPDQQKVQCRLWCVSTHFMQSHFSVHFLWHDLFCLCGTGYRKHSQTVDGSWIRVWMQGPNVCQRQRHTHHIFRKNAIWREVDGFKDKHQHPAHSGTSGSLSMFTETLHNSTKIKQLVFIIWQLLRSLENFGNRIETLLTKATDSNCKLPLGFVVAKAQNFSNRFFKH